MTWSIFSCTCCWPFEALLWRTVYSRPLPIFNWVIYLFITELSEFFIHFLSRQNWPHVGCREVCVAHEEMGSERSVMCLRSHSTCVQKQDFHSGPCILLAPPAPFPTPSGNPNAITGLKALTSNQHLLPASTNTPAWPGPPWSVRGKCVILRQWDLSPSPEW